MPDIVLKLSSFKHYRDIGGNVGRAANNIKSSVIVSRSRLGPYLSNGKVID